MPLLEVMSMCGIDNRCQKINCLLEENNEVRIELLNQPAKIASVLLPTYTLKIPKFDYHFFLFIYNSDYMNNSFHVT